MKLISNIYEKYFHNSDFSTYFLLCQYISEIFFMQKRVIKYFKYFIQLAQKTSIFENNFHFSPLLHFRSEILKKSFIYSLFIII
jgi:hypothetical protein